MEDGQGPYSHEEEVRGLNISVGNEETKSNGIEREMEPLELVETMRSLNMEVQSCRDDNERLLKVQEKQNQLNTQLLQSLNQLQRKIKNGLGSRHEEEGRSHARRDSHRISRHSRSATKTQRHHYSPTHSTKKSYASEESKSSPKVSLVRHQRRRHEQDNLQGELRKIKPPTFDGENKMGEDVEAWLLGIRKYFQLHNYSSNLEAKIVIYHLQGKASMWWDQLKQVKHINERRISWKQFKKYFQQ
jgi:hypothetical protein